MVNGLHAGELGCLRFTVHGRCMCHVHAGRLHRIEKRQRQSASRPEGGPRGPARAVARASVEMACGYTMDTRVLTCGRRRKACVMAHFAASHFVANCSVIASMTLPRAMKQPVPSHTTALGQTRDCRVKSMPQLCELSADTLCGPVPPLQALLQLAGLCCLPFWAPLHGCRPAFAFDHLRDQRGRR
jgi:hypothetical protein